jgi:hypothetical protein
MLVSEIATRVKKQYGDEAGLIITDADIIRWVNDAQLEIASRVDVLQGSATASALASVADYTFPVTYLRIHSIKWRGKRLRELNLQQAEELIPEKDNTSTYPVGEPQYYWVWGNVFTLYPMPQLTEAAALRVFYIRTPVAVTAVGDTPELPVKYHPRIVEYCMAQAAELDENDQRYNNKISQFTQGIQNEQGRDRTTQYYPFITDIGDGESHTVDWS